MSFHLPSFVLGAFIACVSTVWYFNQSTAENVLVEKSSNLNTDFGDPTENELVDAKDESQAESIQKLIDSGQFQKAISLALQAQDDLGIEGSKLLLTAQMGAASSQIDKAMNLLDAGEVESASKDIERVFRAYPAEALSESRSRVSSKLYDAVRPIPASELRLNKDLYRVLALVEPDNTTFQEKHQRYAKLLKQQQEARKAEQIAVKKRQLAKATASMRKKEDKLEKITWYYDKRSPRYTSSRSAMFLYFGKRKDGPPWLRLRLQYTAGDWLFVRDADIFVDGRKYQPFWGEFERDHGSGDIWEWIDLSPSSTHLQMIRDIIDSKEATIRFRGDQYHSDKVISAGDKAALNQVLVAFNALGGAKHY
ncbi:MAG: hypothetical protein AAF495_09645 [Pseudomonadota bacterium]